MTTNYARLAETIAHLYRAGRAEHITYFERAELVEVKHPTEARFFYGVARILSDMSEIHITWEPFDGNPNKKHLCLHANGDAEFIA